MLCVDFPGHVELGVAQDLHHDAGVDVEVDEQGGAGAAGVVDGDGA
jgi:hypothetical protein